MKRAILISLGTVAGTAAVLGYHPGTWFASASPSSAEAAPSAQTFTGDAVESGYGPVQVEITVEAGRITDAIGTQQATDGRSQQIASYALPQLEQQAVSAQGAGIDGVSGASYTSAGFQQSLQSALAQAGLG